MRRPAFFAGLLLAAGAAFGQEAGAPSSPAAAPLTLAAAAEQALAAHPTLAAGRARAADAALAVEEAEAGGRITARWLTTLTQYKEPNLVSPIHSFGPGLIPPLDETLFQSTLSGSYVLWDSGARQGRIAVAVAQEGVAGANLGAAEQQLLARLAGAYAQVLTRRQVLEAALARRDAVMGDLDRATKLVEVGKAAEVETLRAEASLASAEAEIARLASALDLAERELARLLGVPVAATRAAALEPLDLGEEKLPPRDQLLAAALERSPDAAAARLQIAAAEANRRLARTAYFPDLRIGANLQEFGSSEGHEATEWNAGVTLNVPLWDGGVTGRRVARAAVQRDEAAARLAAAELDLGAAIDRALSALDEARARRSALERAADRLVEVARVQKLLLEVGSGTQVDYLAAEAELAATRASLYEARIAGLLARVELARVLAELSPAFLASHLAIAPASPETPR